MFNSFLILDRSKHAINDFNVYFYFLILKVRTMLGVGSYGRPSIDWRQLRALYSDVINIPYGPASIFAMLLVVYFAK